MQVEPAKKASDWKEFTAPDGRKYYYNSSTKVSSWTMPDELKKGSDTPSAVKASPAAHGTPSVQVRLPALAPHPSLDSRCHKSRVRGFIVSRCYANYVNSSHAFLFCSATSGLNTADRKKPAASFPSVSNTREDVPPAIKPT